MMWFGKKNTRKQFQYLIKALHLKGFLAISVRCLLCLRTAAGGAAVQAFVAGSVSHHDGAAGVAGGGVFLGFEGEGLQFAAL